MPLLSPDTRVAEETMRSILGDLVKDLGEMRATLENPPAEVTAPHRLQTAKQLLDDALASAKTLDVPSLSKEEARVWVNLLYDLSQVSVEYLKTCTTMPQVPRARPRSPG